MLFGLVVIAYYPAAELYSSWKLSQLINSIDRTAAVADDSQKQEILAQAHAWNQQLAGEETDLSAEEIQEYDRQLTSDGLHTAFGSVVIPSLSIRLPIYHGTSDAVLSAGVGHIEWSSLPVGGVSSHCLLSAHSGMKSMRAFDDIRDLKIGDYFAVRVMGDLYGYKVVSIDTVLPEEVNSLKIEKGKDLCTLITCTPYGVNSHRLLVRGERSQLPEDFEEKQPEIVQVVRNRRVWPFLVAFGVILLVLLFVLVRKRKDRKKS